MASIHWMVTLHTMCMFIMWSPIPVSGSHPVPCARKKHASTLHGPHLYLFGGRNGNIPLRDLWRYHIANNYWTLLEGDGESPGCLQEHTMIAYNNILYIFGGEVGFSNGSETPLWMYEITYNKWKKHKSSKGHKAPTGRRGHTATIYQECMYIYGGYQDFKGSISDLWAYNFASEDWCLVAQGEYTDIPSPRHCHSAIFHDYSMWVFGGMTDLDENSDFWRWDFVAKRWKVIKSKPGPGCRHSHTAVKFLSVMLIFGGEKEGQILNELWRFHFATEFWEKLTFCDTNQVPKPRAQSTAFIFSHFQSSRGTIHYLGLTEQNIFDGYFTSDRNDFTSKSEYVRQYNFKPVESVMEEENINELKQSRKEFMSEMWKDLKFKQQSNFQKLDKITEDDTNNVLKDIKKVSQVNLSRLSRYCSYSIFQNESSESLNPSPCLSPCLNIKNVSGKVKGYSLPLNDNEIKFELQQPLLDKFSTRRSDSIFTFQSYDYSSSRCSTVSSIGSMQKSGSVQNKLTELPIKLMDLEEKSYSLLGINSPVCGSFANPNYLVSDGEKVIDPLEPYSKFNVKVESSLPSPWNNHINNNSFELSTHVRASNIFRNISDEQKGDNQLILLMYILGGLEIGHIPAFKRPLSMWKLDLTNTF
ncbi:uncharacterized protein [Lepeophtheirus salmonis]|uniref:uncharacterized protein isoform X2 n=2 Tax=Lepeophtheirus salmonis TaxID=72036 RepID=UPI001AE87F9F|nr:uncharacterized protein LOC121126812 isoform X2 [Lepeophtheirus salmonis]